jgi:hypothetical protein
MALAYRCNRVTYRLPFGTSISTVTSYFGWDRKMKKLISMARGRRALLGGFLAMSLVACQDISGPTTQSSGGKDGPRVNPNTTTRVALLVPSGSGNANQENLANNLIRAAEMALADFPNAKIDMRVYGTAGDAGQAAVAAQKAISQGAKIIIGPLFAEAANSVGKVAAAKNINVLSFSNNTQVAGGNVFVLGNTFNNTADRIVGFASAKGYKSVAVVTPNNSAGAVAASAVKSAASRTGARFAGTYTYPFSPDGITASAAGIASKINSSGSTAVVLTADSASGLPLLAQSLSAGGMASENVKVLGLARWDIPQSTLSTPGLRGGWFAIPDGAAISAFNGRFNNTYGTAPHPLAGIAYDGMKAFATLLSQKNAGAAQRSQLTRSQGFRGASGAFRLLKNGSTQRALSVAEASAGGLRVISSAPTKFGGSGS